MDEFGQQGIKLFLYIVGVFALLGIGGGMVYYLRNYRMRAKSRKRQRLGLPPYHGDHGGGTPNRQRSDDAAANETPVTQPPNLAGKDALLTSPEPIGRRHAAESLLVDLIGDLKNLVQKYQHRIEAMEKTGQAQGRSVVDAPDPAPIKPAASSPLQSDAIPLNDASLIDWWNRNGSHSLESCRASLNREFGDLAIAVVEGSSSDPDDWYVLAVSSPKGDYWALPRKTGWVKGVFDKWFQLFEQGAIRGNEMIRQIRPPLSRIYNQEGQWHMANEKCFLSIRD